MPSNKMRRTPSVLVFYGGNGKKYADGLVENLCTLGCDASILTSLASPPGGVADKLNYYFPKARFFVAVVTGEQRIGGNKQPKDDILPEIMKCLTERPNDTLVLLEKDTHLPATLPNVVYEPFERAAFFIVIRKVYDRLIAKKLLRSMAASHSPRQPRIRKSGVDSNIRLHLADFLNETQHLWIFFDSVWDSVAEREALVAKYVANRLDEFAQEYYYALLGIINEQNEHALQKHLRDCLKRCENAVIQLMNDLLEKLKAEAAMIASVTRGSNITDKDRNEWMHRGNQHLSTYSNVAELADKVAAFKDAALNYMKVLGLISK